MKLPQFFLSCLSRIALRVPFCHPVVRRLPNWLGLPLTAKLIDYARDFENAIKSDDWSSVEKHFSQAAEYRVRNTSFDCHLVGASRIMEGFRRSLDGFDRQLKRSPSVEGPHEDGDTISFIWVNRYVASNAPPLVLSARATLRYQEGLISLITEDYLPGSGEKATRWIEQYNPHLDPSYVEA